MKTRWHTQPRTHTPPPPPPPTAFSVPNRNKWEGEGEEEGEKVHLKTHTPLGGSVGKKYVDVYLDIFGFKYWLEIF